LFAWPAGLGDITVGVVAPFIALALQRDPRFAQGGRYVAWNVFGIVDLVVVSRPRRASRLTHPTRRGYGTDRSHVLRQVFCALACLRGER